MNTFDEARKYFEKFVQNHSREYFESMKEYGSRSYGEFINSSEIIQTSRDIAHNLREEFCDLDQLTMSTGKSSVCKPEASYRYRQELKELSSVERCCFQKDDRLLY